MSRCSTTLFAANDMSLQNYLITGEVNVFHHPVHKTKDGYLTANVGPDFRAWQNVCKAMGKDGAVEGSALLIAGRGDGEPRCCDRRGAQLA